MLADYPGPAYADVLKHTSKLATGITLGSVIYAFGAIPAHAMLSSMPSRKASLTYAVLMGLGSVWFAQHYARTPYDLATIGSAAVFSASTYTALVALATPSEPPIATLSGLFDLDNRQAIQALTRLPL